MSGRPLEVDLTDCRIGRLTVVGRAPNRSGKVYWHCVCDCGNVRDVQTFDLLFGKTRSCGCYRREHCSANLPKSAESHINTETAIKRV